MSQPQYPPPGPQQPPAQPYGAPQPQYGAPQQPYGAQPPQQFGGPQQYGAPLGANGLPVPPAPVAKKSSKVRLIVSLVAIVVVAVIAIVGYATSRNDAHNAKVGDCLAGQSADSLKIVACSKPHQYTVAGQVKGKTADEFRSDDSLCDAYPTATSAYWWGKEGEKGDVLCLADAS